MEEAPVQANESDRLKELDSYSILDTLTEEEYDDITAIAAQICGTEISLISLIDEKRQWFKSHHGLGVSETPREYAFCAHAINDQDNIFIVQDARRDIRFQDNPLVTGEPHVIFYAGVPLVSDNNLPLGTLCVIDHKPKLLSQRQIQSLCALGKQVMHVLNLRKTKASLEKALVKLEEKNQELEDFAFVAAHDLKSPLVGIASLADLFAQKYAPQLDEAGKEMIGLMSNSANQLKSLIDGLLEYSRSENELKENKTEVVLDEFLQQVSELFLHEQQFNLKVNASIKKLVINRSALQQILINLVANAIKYNDKPNVEIEIGISASDTHYEFYVKDNGPGIPIADHEKVFQIFKVMAPTDRFGRQGNGIGLATVKKVVEHCGGTIQVRSAPSEGATFLFTLQI